jgi:hypothetical protein
VVDRLASIGGFAERLEELRLDHNANLDDAGARRLASACWAGLRRLDLSAAGMSALGIQALALSTHLRDLTELRVDSTDIRRGGLRHVARSHWHGLRVLAMDAPYLVPAEDVRTLVGAPMAGTLRELRLPILDGEGLRVLLTAPALGGLVCLGLRGAEGVAVGPTLAGLLSEAGHLRNLRELRLASCHLGDAGAAELARCERLAGVAVLDLRRNGIGPAGFEPLMASPHLAGLGKLRVGFNPGAAGDSGRRLLDHFGDHVVEGAEG